MIHYRAPHPLDLQRLEGELGFTGEDMAGLAGLAGGSRWRKYTGGAAPSAASLHLLFFIAARLALSPTQLRAVGQKMIELGADVNPDELPMKGKTLA